MSKEKNININSLNSKKNSEKEDIEKKTIQSVLLNFTWEVSEQIKNVIENILPTLNYNKIDLKNSGWYIHLSVYIKDKNWENNEILFVTDKNSKTKNMKIYPQDHIRDYYYELKDDAKKNSLNEIFKCVEFFLETGKMPDLLEKKSLDPSNYM